MQTHRFLWLLPCLAALPHAALAARVASVSPSGEVAEVRQVQVRFDTPVVTMGDLRAAAPYALACNGSRVEGDRRWLDDKRWVFDLREPLAAGQRCTLTPNAAFKALDGSAPEGLREQRFSTGAPIVVNVQPYAGSRIAEDQHFLVRTNGPVDAQTLRSKVHCEAEGLADRIGIVVVEGAARDAVRRDRARGQPADRLLLLTCQRPFAPEAKVRLVWGLGSKMQRFEWQVQARFTAEFTCERENAQAACLPLRPMALRFNAPVPRELALAARLVPDTPAGGKAVEPKPPDGATEGLVEEVRFAAPLPENTRFRLTLPQALRDAAGRPLANAANFPLAVATAGMPPLAKFAGAPFGVVEAGAEAMMPLTLRHVQADLAGASTSGRVAIKRLDASTPDIELLRWLGRLRDDNDRQYQTRTASLLAKEAGVTRAELPQLKAGSSPAATEVLGVPLPQRGYHVIEVESRVLGHALLENKAPMYTRTGALVANLAVHFKAGRSSSLVWVTSLDRGRPVPNAKVNVNDCRGKPLFSGSTGADGTLRIERGFERYEDGEDCIGREGLFVTARTADDLSFVFSRWQRGIEAWRFDLPTSGSTTADSRAHTVFDRTLLRVGEVVSMKHFVRIDTERGLALPATDTLPNELVLTHQGSGSETVLPLVWPRGARASESRWDIPKTAKLGAYDVALKRGEQRLASGSFRVEAFRVPLVDARLNAPSGVQVAPAELAFAAQLNAFAGGPMAGAPVELSALLRPASVQFAGYDDFSFDRAGRRGEDDGAGARADDNRLVADKLAARTDKNGAAVLEATGLPKLVRPSELLAELRFSDPNGEVQTVAQRVRLWPAAHVVGLRVPGWAASRDGEVGATAVVLSTTGQPLADKPVEIVGRALQTLTTRKRIVGGFYAYDNQRTSKDLGTLCSGKTDSRGRLVCSLKLQASGEVELIARAKDDAGRTSEAAASLWLAAAGGEWWFEQDNDDRIDVLPEQREVEPGQTARLQVRMPFRQATALVTVEREGVIDSRVLTLTGREPVVEVPIPVSTASAADQSWAPNVIVSVLVLRGRLREAPWWSFFTWGWREPGSWWQAFRYEGREYRAPTSTVDLAKPTFKLGVAQLNVGLAAHRLDVKVAADKPQYAVRETAQATVTVTQGGKPAAGAEVAFAAVDEGLLALADNPSWKLLEGLMQDRPWGVETATVQGEVVGRRHYGRKALPPGGGGGRNPTRELFDTLLLWRGTVVLDANGQARIAVPLNDSLTGFRLVAIADAGADRFGTGSAQIRVSQDLQMLSGLAPVLREGDRIDATFTLRNTTARAMALKATLRGAPDGAGNAAVDLPPQTLNLAAGAAQELRWAGVAVPAGATRIEWTGAVQETQPSTGDKPARDAIKFTSVVEPAVPVRVQQATLLPLEASLNLSLAPPADAVKGAGSVTVAMLPTLTGALPGLRRFFETYPYSCLEQKASRAIGLRDATAWARVRDELPAYLDSDGLANYYPPSGGDAARGSDKLTAYLISAAHEAGWAWPDTAREAMLGGLLAFVEGRVVRSNAWAPRPDLEVRKLAALDALARHGRALPRHLGSISWAPAAWPTSAVLDAWSLYARAGTDWPERAARLDELQRLVRSRLTAGGTTLKFSTESTDDWWWLMDGPDANAMRLLLLATPQPAWKEDLPALLTGSLSRQRRGAWLTTTANVWGVLALERFAKTFEATPVSGRSSVSWGSSSKVFDWGAAPAAAASAPPRAVVLPWPAQALSQTAPLQARHDGAGRPWLAVQALAAVPLTAPLNAGYRISRSVVAVERKQPSAWTRGDVLRVRLEIDATVDMAWVVVSDPVPAGATLLGSGLGRDSAIAAQGTNTQKREGRGWLAYEERAASAWRAYYEWLPRGTHTVEYTVRLNASGRFGLPPSRVEAMYAPETFGEVPNATLEVVP